jgi:hypothetical protein
MGYYTPEQLAHEQSLGLSWTKEDNERAREENEEKTLNWTNEQFEKWLSKKGWNEKVKNHHRSEFKGEITFDSDGDFSY